MATASDREPRAKVVIAGGGVAGIEALLALRDMAGDRADLALVADRPDFVYRPLLVEEPFGLDPAEAHELSPLAEELGAEFVPGRLTEVDADAGAITLADGSQRPFDELVVCVGGTFAPAFDGVTTFPSPQGPTVLIDEVLKRASETGGGAVAFVVPPTVAWALPLYEVALMTRRRAEERGLRSLEISFLTPEPSPLAVFGSRGSQEVAELLASRHIEFRGGVRVHQENRSLLITPGDEALPPETEVVALPAMTGPAIPGLPADDDGFIRIDGHARVRGLTGVYAAGDGADFPIKQGGIATQQADAAAADIAHRLGAAVEPEPFHPVLRGKLLTGAESVHMRLDVGGGGGEGEASLDPLWWPPQKVSGRYLAPWLYHGNRALDSEPPEYGLDVEVSLPKEWHADPLGWDPG